MCRSSKFAIVFLAATVLLYLSLNMAGHLIQKYFYKLRFADVLNNFMFATKFCFVTGNELMKVITKVWIKTVDLECRKKTTVCSAQLYAVLFYSLQFTIVYLSNKCVTSNKYVLEYCKYRCPPEKGREVWYCRITCFIKV